MRLSIKPTFITHTVRFVVAAAKPNVIGNFDVLALRSRRRSPRIPITRATPFLQRVRLTILNMRVVDIAGEN